MGGHGGGRTRRPLGSLWHKGMLLVLFACMGSLMVARSEDASSVGHQQQQQQQHHLQNPCQFGHGNFLYCQCDPDTDDLPEVTEAKCWLGRDVKPQRSSKEWKAISRLTNLNLLEFYMWNKELRFFIPTVVFRRMNNLTYFMLKMADLDSIPSYAFANSSSLREVVLESNDIRLLEPNAFANMLSLTTLNLRSNLLLEVNRGVFVNLPELTRLYLDQNQIRFIHDRALAHLWALEELDLHSNSLSTLTPEVFANLTRLRRLDLRSNTIDFLGERVFAEMPNLDEVDLTKNRIISVHPEAFAGLRKLTRLTLKENKIVRLDSRTFEGLNRIYFLDLRLNELETLDEDLVAPIYDNLRNVSTQLFIEGNRFICDCGILWIQGLYNETDSTSVRFHLNNMECNLFQRHKHPSHRQHRLKQDHRDHEHSGGHNHHHHNSNNNNGDQATLYLSNFTMVSIAPEETTSFAEFDSTRKVLSLDPKELDCEDKLRSTTILSIQTQDPLMMEPEQKLGEKNEEYDDDADETVMKNTKKSKIGSNDMMEVEHNVLSDTPNLDASQSSHSSRQSSNSGSAASYCWTSFFSLVSSFVIITIVSIGTA